MHFWRLFLDLHMHELKGVILNENQKAVSEINSLIQSLLVRVDVAYFRD